MTGLVTSEVNRFCSSSFSFKRKEKSFLHIKAYKTVVWGLQSWVPVHFWAIWCNLAISWKCKNIHKILLKWKPCQMFSPCNYKTLMGHYHIGVNCNTMRVMLTTWISAVYSAITVRSSSEYCIRSATTVKPSPIMVYKHIATTDR